MLEDKQEAKFRGVMSAQNTHHIPTIKHAFWSFHTLISVFIALYLIIGFLCISGENDGVWKLCEGLKELIEDPSPMSRRPHVATLRSNNFVASLGLGQREFQIRRETKREIRD